jgi:hypothetical protein
MKDLLKYFSSMHQNAREDVDHTNDGRTSSDLNLGARTA